MNADDEKKLEGLHERACRYASPVYYEMPIHKAIIDAYALGRASMREEAARVADQWATNEQRRFGNGGPAAAIRAIKE